MLEKPCISIRELLSSLKKNRGKKKKEKMQRNIFEQRLQEISPPSPPLSLSVINSPQKKKKKRRRKKKRGGKFALFFPPPLNNPAGKTIVYSLSSTFPHNTLGSRVSVARNSHKSRPRFPSAGAEKKSQPPPACVAATHEPRFFFPLSQDRMDVQAGGIKEAAAVQQQVHNFAKL